MTETTITRFTNRHLQADGSSTEHRLTETDGRFDLITTVGGGSPTTRHLGTFAGGLTEALQAEPALLTVGTGFTDITTDGPIDTHGLLGLLVVDDPAAEEPDVDDWLTEEGDLRVDLDIDPDEWTFASEQIHTMRTTPDYDIVARWIRVNGQRAFFHSSQTVYFYQETDQDIERVLDIFIRVNSAGTQLSYSDLLLSIATAQWKERDARQEIHELVDALNATGAGFRFTHDLVLKSGLVLSGVKDIRFKVKNFTVENMQRLNDEWDKIADALRVAVGLLHDFGLSGANVTARSILIPLATYVHHRGLTHAYREAPGEARDRKALRDWTLRSLVIPGVWGSGLDSLLTALRETITRHGSRQFPSQEIERVMASRGKTLAVTPELVDTLLDRQYGEAGTFAVLATLFPHVNTRNVHHVDHVFPSARLTRAELRKAGHPEDEVDAIFQCKDRLPNLQLLEGPENSSKSAKLPVHWLESAYPTGDVQQNYLALNALPTLPDSTAGFLDFYEARRELLRAQLTRTLGTGGEEAEDIEDADGVLPPIDEAIESESVSDDHLEAD